MASPPRMQTASAGHRESPVTPSNRIVNDALSTKADCPGASSNSRLRGTVGPVTDSSHAANARTAQRTRYRITGIEDTSRARRYVFHQLGGTSADHQAGGVRRGADDARHHRGVGDAESRDTAHAQVAVDNGMVVAAHPAGTGRVIDGVHGAPGELCEGGVADGGRARIDLFGSKLFIGRRRGELARETD